MNYYKIILNLLYKLINISRILEFLKSYLNFTKNQNRHYGYFFNRRTSFRKTNVELLKHIPQLHGLFKHIIPSWTLDYFYKSNLHDVLINERKGGDLRNQNIYLNMIGREVYRLGDVFSERRWFKIPFFFSKFTNLKKKSSLNHYNFLFFQKNFQNFRRGEEAAVNSFLSTNFIQLHSLYNTLAMTSISDDDYIFKNKDDFVFFPYFTFKNLDIWSLFILFFYGVFEIFLLFFCVKLWYGSIFDFFFFLCNNFFIISPYALLSSNTSTLYMVCFTLLIFLFFMNLITWLFPEDDEESYGGITYDMEDSEVGIFPPSISVIGDFFYTIFYVLPMCILWVFFVSKILAFIVIVFKIFLFPLVLLPIFLVSKLYNKIYNYWYTTPPHRFLHKSPLRKTMRGHQSIFYWNTKLHKENYLNNLFIKRTTDRFFNKSASQFNIGDISLRRQPLRLNRKNLFFWSHPSNLKKNRRDFLKMLQRLNNHPISFLDEKQKQYFPRKKTYKIINPLLERFWLYTLLKYRASDEDIIESRYEDFLDDRDLNRYESFYLEKEDILERLMQKQYGLKILRMMHGFFETKKFQFHPAWNRLAPLDFSTTGSRVNPADSFEFGDFKENKNFSRKRQNSLGRARIFLKKRIGDFPNWTDMTAYQVSTFYPQSLNFLTLNYNKRFLDLFLKGWHNKILKIFGTTWYSDVTEYPEHYRYFFLKMPDKPYLGSKRLNRRRKGKLKVRKVRKLFDYRNLRRLFLHFSSFLKRTENLSRLSRRVYGEYYFRSFLNNEISHGIFSKYYFDRNFLFANFLAQRNPQILDRLLEKTVSSFFSDNESRKKNLIFFPNLRLRQKLISNNKLSSSFFQRSIFDIYTKTFMMPFSPFDNLDRKYYNKLRNRIVNGKYYIRRYSEGIFQGQEMGTPLYRRHLMSKYRIDLLKFIMQLFRSIEWEFLTFDKTNKEVLGRFLRRRTRVKRYRNKILKRLKSTFFDKPGFYVNLFDEEEAIRKKAEKNRRFLAKKIYSSSKTKEELKDLTLHTEERFNNEFDEDDEDDEDEFTEKNDQFYLPYAHLLFLKREQDRVWSFFSKYQNDFLQNLVKTTGNPLIKSKYSLNTYLTLRPFFTLNKKKDSVGVRQSFWHKYRNLRKFESFFLTAWKDRLEKKKYSSLVKIYNKKTFYFDVKNPLLKYRLSLINFFELERALGLTKYFSLGTKTDSHNIKFFFRKNLEFENQFKSYNNSKDFKNLFLEYKYFLQYFKDKYSKENKEVLFFLKNDLSNFSKYFLFIKLYELYKVRLIQRWFVFDTGTNLYKKNIHYQGYSRFSQLQSRQKKRLTLLFSDYLQWKKWRFFEKAKLQKKILQLNREIDSVKVLGKLNFTKNSSTLNKKFSNRIQKYLLHLQKKLSMGHRKLKVVLPNMIKDNEKTTIINSYLLKNFLKKNVKTLQIFSKSKYPNFRFLKPYVVNNFFSGRYERKVLFSNYLKLLLDSWNNKKNFRYNNSISSITLLNKIYYEDSFLNDNLRNFSYNPSQVFNLKKMEGFKKGDYSTGLNTSLNGRNFLNLNFRSNFLNVFLDLNPTLNTFSSKKRSTLSFIPSRSPIIFYGLDPFYSYRKFFFRKYIKPVDKYFTNRIPFSDRYFAHNDQNSVFFNRKSFLNKRFLFSQNNYLGFVFQNSLPLLTELEIKKNFFSQFNRIFMQSIYFSIYENKLNIKKNEEFDFGFFFYHIYNLLIRKYINYIFANQQIPSYRRNRTKNINRLKNLFLILKLRDVNQFSTKNGKDILTNFYFNYYSSPQKITIPFSRFIFWLLRNEKLNSSIIQNMKEIRQNKVNKHFFSVNYPSLFVDKVIKNKKFFFLYGRNNKYKETFPKKLWEFLLKDSFFPLSFLSTTVRKRLVVYKKQRKLYKQFVLPYLLNLSLFKNFMSEKRKVIRWEEFPRKTKKFTYSKSKLKDLLNIRLKKLGHLSHSNFLFDESIAKYFLNRKFLHNFLNGIYILKNKDQNSLLKLFSLYAQYPNYRIQFFFRSLIINTYLMRLFDINNSIFNFHLLKKNSEFFVYNASLLLKNYPYYTQYLYFLNHIFPFKPMSTQEENINNDFTKEKFFYKNKLKDRDRYKKERFLRRKLQYIKRYFLINTSSSINLRQIDKYIFIKKFKDLRKFRKFDYILKNLLEIPLKKRNMKAFQDFYFDWNYSFFDLVSSNRKEKLNLIKKHFLNTYPGVKLPISSFGNRQIHDLFILNNNIFLKSIKPQHGVEVYPRYSSYNIRNKFFDSIYKNNKLLSKTYIDDPYKLQRYLKSYNLVGKRFNIKRQENLKYSLQSFWKLQVQNLLQHFFLHYDISQIDKHLFVNDWNSYMFKNLLANQKTALASGNFFVQPREYAALYYFLNPSFNKKFLPIYDKFLKNKKFINLRSDLFLKIFINKKKSEFWKLLHTKFKYQSYLNFLLWIKRKYGVKFSKDFKKNNFLWKDSFELQQRPLFRSFFQRTHRVHYKSFFSPKRRVHRGNDEERNWHRTKASVIFLKPSAAFSDGKIKIPSDKIRPKFFILRQSILQKLRKAIFAFKASTGFLYFNYKIKEWNDRLIPHVRSGDNSRFLDLELEESIISRTNDLFLPAYKAFKFPNLPFVDKYSTLLNKISDASLNFSNSYIDGLILRLHSFWNRVSFFSHDEYTQKDSKCLSNLVVRQQDNNFAFYSKKNYSFYNTETFLSGFTTDGIKKDISINSFLESDFFLAEQFRMLAYEEILKYSKQYETLILSRKYQHFLDLNSILEKNIFFQKNMNDFLNLQLKNIYELEPFFSSLYYGLELHSSHKLKIMQKNFFDHFFNLVSANSELSLFLKTNLFNHFNKWFFLDKQSPFTLFKDIQSFLYKKFFFDDLTLFSVLNLSSSRYFSRLLLNDSFGFFAFFEHFFLKMYYIFFYIFKDSSFFYYLKYTLNLDWIYSSNFFFFLINFGIYFFFFILYFLFIFLYFFWLKKNRFQKNPFFFNNFSDQIKNVPVGWDWQIMRGAGAFRSYSKALKKPSKTLLQSPFGFTNENTALPTMIVNGWIQNNFFEGSGFFDEDHDFDLVEDSLFEQGTDSEYVNRNNEKLNIFYKILTQNVVETREIQNREIKFRNLSLKKNKSSGFAKTLYNGKILSYKLKFFHSTFNAKPSKKSIFFNPNLNLFGRNLFILETIRRQFFLNKFLTKSSNASFNNNIWTKWFSFVNKNGDLTYQQNLFFDKIFGNYFTNLIQLNFERFMSYLKIKKFKYNIIWNRKQKMGLLKSGKRGKIDKFKKILPFYIRKAFNKSFNSYRLTGNVFYFLYKKRFNFSSKICKKFYYNLQYKKEGLSYYNYLFLSVKWKNFVKISKIQKIKRLHLRKKFFLQLLFTSEKRNFNLNPYFHFFRFFPFFFKNKFLDIFSFDSLDNKPQFVPMSSADNDFFLSKTYNRSFFSFRETLLDKQHYSWNWFDTFLVATFFYFKFLLIVFLSFIAVLFFLKFFVPFFIFAKFWIKILL